jgi:hypothetical protein
MEERNTEEELVEMDFASAHSESQEAATHLEEISGRSAPATAVHSDKRMRSHSPASKSDAVLPVYQLLTSR